MSPNHDDSPPEMGLANGDLADSLADELAELAGLDPARAELWVSGLLADYGSAATVDALVAQAPFDMGSHRALLTAAISVVAEAPDARRAAALCTPDYVTSPEWARHLGSAKPVDAMRVYATDEHMTTIVRFEHGDASRHLVMVDLGSVAAPYEALDIRFAPDGLFEEEFDEPGLELRPASLDEVTAEFVGAIERPNGDESSIELNLLVARRRAESLWASELAPIEASSTIAKPVAVSVAAEARDEGADSAAIEALEAALGKWFVADGAGSSLAPTLDDYAAAAATIRNVVGGPEAADFAVVLAAAGLDGSEDDVPLVLGSCGAYVIPQSLDAFEATEVEAIRHLEWADWFGAVAVLVRKGPGTLVTPSEMVRAINRCPEVTTTIPKADAEYVAWSFERTLHAWELTGVLSPAGELTAFGQRVLPHALRHRWRNGVD